MILINAAERKAVSEQYPEVHIRRTMPQKSKRHRYYMEENSSAMRLVREMRNPRKGNAG